MHTANTYTSSSVLVRTRAHRGMRGWGVGGLGAELHEKKGQLLESPSTDRLIALLFMLHLSVYPTMADSPAGQDTDSASVTSHQSHLYRLYTSGEAISVTPWLRRRSRTPRRTALCTVYCGDKGRGKSGM